MRQLNLYDGYPVWIQHICKVKTGTFARFKPILSKRVLSIINDENIKKVRHVLEVQLSKYQCLSVGDEIAIEVGGYFLNFVGVLKNGRFEIRHFNIWAFCHKTSNFQKKIFFSTTRTNSVFA